MKTSLIKQTFDLEDIAPNMGEEELLMLLTQRVTYMLDHEMDMLVSLMYRLDIAEHKIKIAFMNEHPAHAIANLFIQRQKDRMKTKEQYKSGAAAPDWAW